MTVLGSGIMGHGIAQVMATAGHEVVLRDIRRDLVDAALTKIKWSLDKMAAKGRIPEGGPGEVMSRITPEVELGPAVKDAEMVIEAVPEVMDLKRKVYAELDAAAPKDAVFASNTSTLPITEMAASTSRPERFVGVHFFNPPQLMKLVEVIPGERTSGETVRLTREIVRSAGKQDVLCRKDVPGFIVNRLFIPMVHEACHARERAGAAREEVDSAVKFRMGFPMGIFELADFTGLDVVHKATEEMRKRDRGVVRPHPEVGRLFGEGRLGQKSGGGFYRYGGGNYERVDLSEGLAERFDPLPLIAGVMNNAAWLVTNGASDMPEIEKAARLGLGLRATLSETAAAAGKARVLSELERLAAAHGRFYEPDPGLAALL